MKEQLEKIKSKALARMEAAQALETLNDIRVAYLGKKGELTTVLKSMKDVAPEDRPKVGQMVNEVRALIESKLEETKTALARKARGEQMEKEVIDVTLPAQSVSYDIGLAWMIVQLHIIILYKLQPLLCLRFSPFRVKMYFKLL